MKKLHLFLVLALALTLAGTAMAQEMSTGVVDNSPYATAPGYNPGLTTSAQPEPSTYDTVPATGLTPETSGDSSLGTGNSLPTSSNAGGDNSTCDTNPCHSGSTNNPGNGGNSNTSNGSASGGRRGGIGGNADEGTPVDLSNLLNYLGNTIHPQSVLLVTPAMAAPVMSDEIASQDVASDTATSTNSDQLAAAAGALGNLGGWSWFWAVVILVVILGLAIYLVRRRPSQQ